MEKVLERVKEALHKEYSYDVELLNKQPLIKKGWHLKEVIIDAPKLGKKWRFPCNRWLDKHEDDGATERELMPIKLSFEEYTPRLLFKFNIIRFLLRI